MEVMSNEEFIRRAKLINGNRYDMSSVKFINPKTKVVCKCNSCNELIEIEPVKLLTGVGCRKCYGVTYLNTQMFIDRAILIYGENAFDYSMTNYTNFHSKLKIKCNKCNNVFNREACTHLRDHECPYCSASEGVQRIWDVLTKYDLVFETERTFSDLKDERHLRYDFYIPEMNTAIEYHGELHYKSGFGSHAPVEELQRRDKIKYDYAQDNHIKLVVITCYDLNKLENILYKELNLKDRSMITDTQNSINVNGSMLFKSISNIYSELGSIIEIVSEYDETDKSKAMEYVIDISSKLNNLNMILFGYNKK